MADSAEILSLRDEAPVDSTADPPLDDRAPIVKSTVLDIASADPFAALFSRQSGSAVGGLLKVPYDFNKLLEVYEASGHLRPNVDAYVTNVDSFGHRFEPAFDLSAPDAIERVKAALLLQRLDGASPDALDDVEEPTDEEVALELKRLRRRALVELNLLRAFFQSVNPEGSFTQLRRQTRHDIEILGNGYWEVTRDGAGRVARFNYVPGATIYMTPKETTPVLVEERVRVSDIHWDTVKQQRQFRRFAQVSTIDDQTGGVGRGVVPLMWFKELGDPRCISQKTGDVYKDEKALRRKEGPTAKPATELLHFSVFSANSSYGIPRWIGALSGVLGSVELDKVNYEYFDKKAVPPLAVLVNGGRLGRGTVSRIEDYFRNTIRGRKNFWKVLILEAEAASASLNAAVPASVTPRIEFKILRQAQQTDALFQTYDGRNAQKIAACFRVPEALRGVTDMSPPAAIDAAVRRAEEQVFGPERDEFDETMNRRILPELDITFWCFRTNAAPMRDPVTLAKVLKSLERVVVPAEAREIAEQILGRQLPVIREGWTRRPIELSLAEFRVAAGPGDAARVAEGQEALAEHVMDTATAAALPPEDAILAEPGETHDADYPHDAGETEDLEEL